jgi:hypothetical protein
MTETGRSARQMLAYLLAVPGASSLFAKCPAELEANAWYEKNGFIDEGTEHTKSGRCLRLWRRPMTKVRAGESRFPGGTQNICDVMLYYRPTTEYNAKRPSMVTREQP